MYLIISGFKFLKSKSSKFDAKLYAKTSVEWLKIIKYAAGLESLFLEVRLFSGIS